MATVEQTQSSHNGAATAPLPRGDGIPVENPATGEIVATVPDLDAAAVAELAKRGRLAQPAWEAYGFEGRGRVLRRTQKWLMDNAERIIETIVSETGKTYEDAQLAEISYGGAAFGFWAKNAAKYLADERVRSSSVLVKGKKLILRYRPLGLIGVIGPWNYPLTNSFGDCIPALAAGNSVILKPSEVTPLTSLLLAEGLSECGVPDDVFQVATGRGDDRRALIERGRHDHVHRLHPHRAQGREAAAERLIPCSLELGGKDPMIVLADADLERAANVATYYSMQNSGQTCISIERVYVEAPVYDEFVAESHRQGARAARGPPGGGPGTVEVGAITFPPQVEIVEDHVNDAVAKGARALTGGHRSAAGRRALLRADSARRRRPLDEDHDRGDVRPDAADHAGARRRGGLAPRQRLRVRPRRIGLHARTPTRARRSRGAWKRARCTSTTRSSTSRRSSCRWAASRPPASVRATARAGSASTATSRRS